MVGSAVDTIVWSRDARIMPSMSATRITRIRRCSALLNSWSSGASNTAAGSGATSVVQIALQRRREPPEQGAEASQIVVVPTVEQSIEPRPPRPQHAFERAPTRRRETNARGSSVLGIGVADDQPLTFELLDLARHRRGIDPEHLRQRRHPDGVAVEVQLVQRGRSGPVEADPRRLQETLVDAHLADRAGDDLEPGLDLFDGRLGDRGSARSDPACADAPKYLLVACNYSATAAPVRQDQEEATRGHRHQRPPIPPGGRRVLVEGQHDEDGATEDTEQSHSAERPQRRDSSEPCDEAPIPTGGPQDVEEGDEPDHHQQHAEDQRPGLMAGREEHFGKITMPR